MPTRTIDGITQRLLSMLGHTPTAGQQRAAEALERLLQSEKEQATLVLKGYAGTGKTTLVGSLVKVLANEQRPVVLLAPTGRAAKVLSAYAGAPASTIHRRIYRMAGEDAGFGGMTVAANRDSNALFVVDEASMIGQSGGDGSFGNRDLLRDLFEHVFGGHGCKLLLIGDPAQLPPVGSDHSPALDIQHLRDMGLLAGTIELTDVVRQTEDSGILVNATALRDILDQEKPMPRFIAGFEDVIRVDGYDLQDALEAAYDRQGADEVSLICRSNKRAYQYSQQVRARIYGYEEELCPGDRLMVVKNNYYWAGKNGRPELIANGEPLLVKQVHGIEERYGLRYMDIVAGWWNGTTEREIDVKLILDTLSTEGPAMPGARMREVNTAIVEECTEKTKGGRSKYLKENPYANALQVKYGYAVTAHKAQGGQWNTVFVDQGYVTEEMIDTEYVRWLYTAITRATDKLYLLNFHPRFWGEDGEEQS